VFRTYEPERDRLVAVKAFRIDITPEQAQTLARELSRAAEAGLFHPSIVEPIAAGVEGSLAYGAEEYVAAESLDIALRHYAPASIETVLPFITQLAGAIDFARAAGIGHGALHPRDIFMTPEEARATGFGVVEALERGGFRAPVRRPYSPPERIAGNAWNTSADVFSLAAITFELLTGRRPAGLGKEIGPLTAGTPNNWMDAIHGVLARAMDENPSARFPTALAFASALEAAGRGEQVAAAAPEALPIPAAAEPAINPVAAVAAASAPAVVPTPPPIVPMPAPAAPAKASPPPAAAEKMPPPQVVKGKDKVEDKIEEDVAEEEDDILHEREEDEAHHRLTLREMDDLDRPEPELPLDEDIAAEKDADEFLLEAGGAASRPDALDDFRPGSRVSQRSFDHDEVSADESQSSLFEPESLLDDARSERERGETTVASPVYRPTFGESPAVVHETVDRESRSPWPLTLVLLFGLIAGFGGGYVLWGRAPASNPPAPPAATGAKPGPAPPASAGREFSEQAVSPSTAKPSTDAPRASSTSKPPSASPAPPSPKPQAPGVAASGSGATKPIARPTTGTIAVRSTPSGAGVTVNGKWRGRTPLTLDDLPLARYEVRIVQPGYTTASQDVALNAAEPTRSLTFRLQEQARSSAVAPQRPAPAPSQPAASPRPQAEPPASSFTGSIFVDSRPRGAKVSIDGRQVGVTPLRVPEVRIGTRIVRLELPDHRIWSSTARVQAGQEARITGSLERIQ
jgi:PEGA domain/Protein kinase domain